MAKDKAHQIDWRGMQILADEFTGSVSGSLAGVTPLTVTATTGSLPTVSGAVTIANAATPTVNELLDLCVELNAKLTAIIAALD